MKYILTKEEIDKIKQDARIDGFIEQEKLLQSVLEGNRNLFISVGGMKSKPPSHDVWIKLIKRLDRKKT